jgi:hypothetical protein
MIILALFPNPGACLRGPVLGATWAEASIYALSAMTSNDKIHGFVAISTCKPMEGQNIKFHVGGSLPPNKPNTRYFYHVYNFPPRGSQKRNKLGPYSRSLFSMWKNGLVVAHLHTRTIEKFSTLGPGTSRAISASSITMKFYG